MFFCLTKFKDGLKIKSFVGELSAYGIYCVCGIAILCVALNTHNSSIVKQMKTNRNRVPKQKTKTIYFK